MDRWLHCSAERKDTHVDRLGREPVAEEGEWGAFDPRERQPVVGGKALCSVHIGEVNDRVRAHVNAVVRVRALKPSEWVLDCEAVTTAEFLPRPTYSRLRRTPAACSRG